MKKIITSLLIFVLLFNFICSRNVVYAGSPDEQAKNSAYTEKAPVSNEGPAEILESGTVSQKQGQRGNLGNFFQKCKSSPSLIYQGVKLNFMGNYSFL